MASSKSSSSFKPTSSAAKTASEPSEFTTSDFEDILDTSTTSPTPTSSSSTNSVARRPVFTISSSEKPTITSISSESVSFARSSVPQTPISAPTSVASPNLFPVTSSQVSRPSSEASTSHNQNTISPGFIAIIAAVSFAFVLIVVAAIILVIRHRRLRAANTQGGGGGGGGGGGSSDLDFEEKYTNRSQYTLYGDPQHKEPLLTQTVTPLLDVPSINQHSRSLSLSGELEGYPYHQGQTSPFLNEDERRAESNTAFSGANYTSVEGDGALDDVVLSPDVSPPNPQSRASVAARKLTPLHIPESQKTAPPSRRQSKSKTLTRAPSDVRAKPPPPDTGSDSDDSASLYSQASASTHRTFTTTRQSTIHPFPYSSFPLPSIPQSPYQGVSKAATSSSKFEPSVAVGNGRTSTNPEYTPSPVDSLGALEEEETVRLGQEETILVATLLQSRSSRLPKQGLAPTRSSSIVSHIERAGSIKPALASGETGGAASRYGPRSRARRAQDAVRSQILSAPGYELRNGGSYSQQDP